MFRTNTWQPDRAGRTFVSLDSTDTARSSCVSTTHMMLIRWQTRLSFNQRQILTRVNMTHTHSLCSAFIMEKVMIGIRCWISYEKANRTGLGRRLRRNDTSIDKQALQWKHQGRRNTGDKQKLGKSYGEITVDDRLQVQLEEEGSGSTRLRPRVVTSRDVKIVFS